MLLIHCVSVITKVPKVSHIIFPEISCLSILWGLKSDFSCGYSPDFTLSLSLSSKF